MTLLFAGIVYRIMISQYAKFENRGYILWIEKKWQILQFLQNLWDLEIVLKYFHFVNDLDTVLGRLSLQINFIQKLLSL